MNEGGGVAVESSLKRQPGVNSVRCVCLPYRLHVPADVWCGYPLWKVTLIAIKLTYLYHSIRLLVTFPIQPRFPIQCKSGFCFVDGSDGGKWTKSHRWVHKWVVHLSNLIVIMNIHLIMQFQNSPDRWQVIIKCIDWCWIGLGHFPHGCKYPSKWI